MVYGALEALGDIGGLAEIVTAAAWFLISLIVNSLYEANLLESLFLEQSIP